MEPKEIQLRYKDEGAGIISLLVDSVAGAEYVWQSCKAGTALWNELSTTDRNTFVITTNAVTNKGDKYRCLVKTNGKVSAYSKVLTVGVRRFRSRDEYTYQGQQYQDRQNSPSVADTDGMDGIEFEQYCVEVLRKNGFFDVKETQGSGDYGIDILAKKESISYAIQCKCYSSTIGNKAVQEAYSGKAFYHCMVAAVLTNNYFTEAAIETAKRNSVVLWDRDYLDNMIKNPGSANREREKQERERQERERQERERQERERQQRVQQERERQQRAQQERARQQQEYERRERERQEQERRRQEEQHRSSQSSMPDFFRGCTSWEQVKERYKKLAQMYHPDHASGDEEYMKAINAQYEELKNKFGQ